MYFEYKQNSKIIGNIWGKPQITRVKVDLDKQEREKREEPRKRLFELI